MRFATGVRVGRDVNELSNSGPQFCRFCWAEICGHFSTCAALCTRVVWVWITLLCQSCRRLVWMMTGCVSTAIAWSLRRGQARLFDCLRIRMIHLALERTYVRITRILAKKIIMENKINKNSKYKRVLQWSSSDITVKEQQSENVVKLSLFLGFFLCKSYIHTHIYIRNARKHYYYYC